ncbi:ferrochelatase [Actinomycetaceae bacterium TAE3-ERU4]|nr:ferrochelatase [Actinomycetaceae bacterium TAE3-ERU4]
MKKHQSDRERCPLNKLENSDNTLLTPSPFLDITPKGLQKVQEKSRENKRLGCLLINLGSPAQPEAKHIRRFLKRFLSDRRVVNLHPILWQPILRGFILTRRPSRIAPVYRSIWTDKGSPLTVHSKAQEIAAANALGEDVLVRVAMTYADPSVESALQEMEAAGINDLTVINLYPQFAASTVAACYDSIFNYYRSRPTIPTLRILQSWETEENYVEFYAQQFAEQLAENKVDALVMSYHGVPEKETHAHEIYRQHCSATTAAIAEKLREKLQINGMELPPILQTFQSKFGPGKWIGPATIDTMNKLPEQGIKKIMVATPGFVSDCIETVDEINVLNREAFMEAGGEEFHVITPLNSSPLAGEIIANLYRQVNNSPKNSE